MIGRRPDPLQRVGVYAPGGRAAYPSSVLMGVIPARVAGVAESSSALRQAPTGCPRRSTLAAAELSGADRVFAVGGAGAIAAHGLRHGDDPSRRSHRRPGKRLRRRGEAAGRERRRDRFARRSERAARDRRRGRESTRVALELLAQAEHDPDGRRWCWSQSERRWPIESSRQIERHLPVQGRRTIIEQAFADRGAVLTAPTTEDAVIFANEFAAEHLLLATRDADSLLAEASLGRYGVRGRRRAPSSSVTT